MESERIDLVGALVWGTIILVLPDHRSGATLSAAVRLSISDSHRSSRIIINDNFMAATVDGGEKQDGEETEVPLII